MKGCMLAAVAVTVAVSFPPLAPYALLAAGAAVLGRRRKAAR